MKVSELLEYCRKQTLTELAFGQTVEYRQKAKGNQHCYFFEIGETKYMVLFTYKHHTNHPLTEFEFGSNTPSGDPYTVSLTGGGNAIKVFSTVITIMKEYIAKNQPEVIEFSAKEPSRVKLYNRLLGGFKQDYEGLGYNLTQKNSDYGADYFLVNKSIKHGEE